MAPARVRRAAVLRSRGRLLGQHLRCLLRRSRVLHHAGRKPAPLLKDRLRAGNHDHLPPSSEANPPSRSNTIRHIIHTVTPPHHPPTPPPPLPPLPQTRPLHPNRLPRPHRPRRRQTRRLLHHHRAKNRNRPALHPPALKISRLLPLGFRTFFFLRLHRCALELRAGVRDRYGDVVGEAVYGVLRGDGYGGGAVGSYFPSLFFSLLKQIGRSEILSWDSCASRESRMLT